MMICALPMPLKQRLCFSFLFLLAVSAYSQRLFEVDNSGLNGFYTGVIENKYFKKPRMTHVYIYEYVRDTGGAKFLCQITQFEGKKASGASKTSYLIASTSNYGGDLTVRTIRNLYNKGNVSFEIKELILLGASSLEIVSLDKYNSQNTISGTYQRHRVEDSRFDDFLMTAYTKLFEVSKQYGQKDSEIVWGKKEANTGKRYNSRKESGLRLFSDVMPVDKLHNSSVIEIQCDYTDMFPNQTKTDDLNYLISNVLKHKSHGYMDPLINHLPKLERIMIKDSRTGMLLYVVGVYRSTYGFTYELKTTVDADKQKQEELAAIKKRREAEEDLKRAREREQERLRQAEIDKAKVAEAAWEKTYVASEKAQKSSGVSRTNLISYTYKDWTSNYGTRDNARILMCLFEGHFDLIPSTQRQAILWNYVLAQSDECAKSIANSKLVRVNVREYQAITMMVQDEQGYVTYQENIVVHPLLADAFGKLAQWYVLNKSNYTPLYANFATFADLQGGCNSKASEQLFKNIIRYMNQEPSIQMKN